ncbi:hypothetical protein B4110_3718 [Parageobacillus toebii]|uniref:Uncharacterized protein n=1 Tax=Parageobacillus toebii TaxID=153151 RepID=A0A150MVV3_9BACL|nr:hypothetical protein GEPA3_3616 [Geobacillus sp. PA-3]KYD28529.1 hypothetical protein B4110_3718 [Parageobacillus toebii]
MFGQGAEQRIVHRLLFLFEPSAQALIQLVLVHVSLLKQPGEDVFSGNAEEIGEDRAEFDIGRLEHFLNPVFLRSQLSDPLFAEAGKIPQFANIRWGDETFFNESMAEQLGDPLGVRDIGFSSRDIFDPLRIGQCQVDIALEEGEDRFPIHAGGFHGDMGNAMFFEPLKQVAKSLRERGEGLNVLLNVSIFFP